MAPFEPFLLSKTLQNRSQLATICQMPAYSSLVRSKGGPTMPKPLPCMPPRCTWVTIEQRYGARF